MEFLAALLLAGLVAGYLVLAGCDIGLGMLMPYVARTGAERRRAVSAMAPYFLGSEVWLIGAVGVAMGLLPALKSHVFTGLWPVFAALLAGWLLRDAGLWMRGRMRTGAARAVCDTGIVGGSWALALSWGAVVGGLLAGGGVLSPVALACAPAAAALFALRGAAFGAERLLPVSADTAARATRPLARTALAAGAVAAGASALPGGVAAERPLAAAAAALVVLGAPAATSGLSGPRLSRHTSAAALASVPLLIAAAVDLPVEPVPAGTAVLFWSALAPVVPFMVLGQVWLYRMVRRPAPDPGFFG
ncbi:cytochrome bd-type quinol oxidase subunit 2 [Streptomonospora salina]|uniref:Cytochrome bd-type quinol oxidase subunit 2 n=2 Tax=Streptomonospora salina TaxID=104205 RepID=A0A841EH22_9ACTN|nr:cytochrome d ubiquinol oxidase subunit II [Streptomonospora salina]MBB5999690.1 cytochrome bd-type quinol oxidase subunit 2 [Streptomonospora salina]